MSFSTRIKVLALVFTGPFFILKLPEGKIRAIVRRDCDGSISRSPPSCKRYIIISRCYVKGNYPHFMKNRQF